jgi:hypothetical protein
MEAWKLFRNFASRLAHFNFPNDKLLSHCRNRSSATPWVGLNDSVFPVVPAFGSEIAATLKNLYTPGWLNAPSHAPSESVVRGLAQSVSLSGQVGFPTCKKQKSAVAVQAG